MKNESIEKQENIKIKPDKERNIDSISNKTVEQEGKVNVQDDRSQGEKDLSQEQDDIIASVETLMLENQALKDKWLRAVAEYQNAEKRHELDLQRKEEKVISRIAKDLTDLLDNMYRAYDMISEDEVKNNIPLKKLFDGIEMVKQSFIKALEKHGVKRIFPKGEKFDHNLHQAISQVEQDQVESGRIVEVMQAGYTLNGKIMKAASVIVAR